MQKPIDAGSPGFGWSRGHRRATRSYAGYTGGRCAAHAHPEDRRAVSSTRWVVELLEANRQLEEMALPATRVPPEPELHEFATPADPVWWATRRFNEEVGLTPLQRAIESVNNSTRKAAHADHHPARRRQPPDEPPHVYERDYDSRLEVVDIVALQTRTLGQRPASRCKVRVAAQGATPKVWAP